MKYVNLGETGIRIPKIIFGTSALGNLYHANTCETKLEIVRECNQNVDYPVFDSAGKYGAGLALESLGSCLNELEVKPEDIFISNKLGWLADNSSMSIGFFASIPLFAFILYYAISGYRIKFN